MSTMKDRNQNKHRNKAYKLGGRNRVYSGRRNVKKQKLSLIPSENYKKLLHTEQKKDGVWKENTQRI